MRQGGGAKLASLTLRVTVLGKDATDMHQNGNLE